MLSVDIAITQGDFSLATAFQSRGGVTALFGASGSGKSTIVRAIAGLTRPVSGRIAIGERVLFDAATGVNLPTHARHIGLVFQESRLFPHLTVQSNLTYSHWAGRRKAGKFNEIIELLGIKHLLSRYPVTLSGGERQRVAIGRALLSSPEILLMDEPLASLDGPRKAEILPFLDRLKREAGLPILYVSHSLEEVTRLADHLVVLSRGRMLAEGPIGEVMQHPEMSGVFGPMDMGVLLEATIARHDGAYGLTLLKINGHEFAVPRMTGEVGTPARLRILARDVALSLTRPQDTSVQNALDGKIVEITDISESYHIVRVELGHGPAGIFLNAQVTRKSVNLLGLKPGLEVWCAIKGVATEPRLLSSA